MEKDEMGESIRKKIRIPRTPNRQEFGILAQKNIWNGKMYSEQYMTTVENFMDGWDSFHRASCIVLRAFNQTMNWIRTERHKLNIENVRIFIIFSGWISKDVFRLLFSIRLFLWMPWGADVAAAFRFQNLATISNNHVQCWTLSIEHWTHSIS